MNKLKLTTATLLLLSLQSQANNSAPAIQMHIFESDDENVSPQPAMHMVIFDDTSTQTSTTESSHSSDENKEINIASTIDDQDISLQFYFDAGYRQDKLNWTIADPVGSPNILSELIWDNIEIITLGIGTTLRTPSNFIFNADFVYGQIIDGNNQDSDYAADNKTLEFSRSNNNADEGNVIDFSISGGYQLDLGKTQNTPVLSLTPKVGFSYHAQNLKMRHGRQTVSNQNNANQYNPAITVAPLGNFNAVLDSTYDASWYGPWAGISSQLNFGPYFSLYGNFEYHYAFYEATADWNLRQDFAHPESFTHEAEGTGINASVGSRIKLEQNLALTLSVDYKKWDADDKGIDTTFGANGSSGETKFNGVNWESFGANIGLQYNF